MRRTPLKCKSTKRAALERKVKSFRDQLVAEVGQCELCNRNYMRYHAEQYLGTKIDYSEFTFSCSC